MGTSTVGGILNCQAFLQVNMVEHFIDSNQALDSLGRFVLSPQKKSKKTKKRKGVGDSETTKRTGFLIPIPIHIIPQYSIICSHDSLGTLTLLTD